MPEGEAEEAGEADAEVGGDVGEVSSEDLAGVAGEALEVEPDGHFPAIGHHPAGRADEVYGAGVEAGHGLVDEGVAGAGVEDVLSALILAVFKNQQMAEAAVGDEAGGDRRGVEAGPGTVTGTFGAFVAREWRKFQDLLAAIAGNEEVAKEIGADESVDAFDELLVSDFDDDVGQFELVDGEAGGEHGPGALVVAFPKTADGSFSQRSEGQAGGH